MKKEMLHKYKIKKQELEALASELGIDLER